MRPRIHPAVLLALAFAAVAALVFRCNSARADSVGPASGGGGINAQTTTPGTQQANTNFNISGVGILSRIVTGNAASDQSQQVDSSCAAGSDCGMNVRGGAQGNIRLLSHSSSGANDGSTIFLGSAAQGQRSDVEFDRSITPGTSARWTLGLEATQANDDLVLTEKTNSRVVLRATTSSTDNTITIPNSHMTFTSTSASLNTPVLGSVSGAAHQFWQVANNLQNVYIGDMGTGSTPQLGIQLQRTAIGNGSLGICFSDSGNQNCQTLGNGGVWALFMASGSDVLTLQDTTNAKTAVTFTISATAPITNIAGTLQTQGNAASMGAWAAETLGLAVTGQNFTGAWRSTAQTPKFRQIACSWSVAGVGGTTGYVIKVRNVTDSTDLCTCTLGACTTAANTPLNCDCNSTSLAAKSYTLQTSSTSDCATEPQNVICSVEMTQ